MRIYMYARIIIISRDRIIQNVFAQSYKDLDPIRIAAEIRFQSEHGSPRHTESALIPGWIRRTAGDDIVLFIRIISILFCLLDLRRADLPTIGHCTGKKGTGKVRRVTGSTISGKAHCRASMPIVVHLASNTMHKINKANPTPWTGCIWYNIRSLCKNIF